MDEKCGLNVCRQEERIKRIERDIEENDKKRGLLHEKYNNTAIAISKIQTELTEQGKKLDKISDWVDTKNASSSRSIERLIYKIIEYLVIAIISFSIFKIFGVK